MIRIESFSFHDENGGRALHVSLTNGHLWAIEAEREGIDGHGLRSLDGTDRTATRRERQILQAACYAFASYLTNEPAPAQLSYGELAALGDLAELMNAPEATRENWDEFLIGLGDCAINYWPL